MAKADLRTIGPAAAWGRYLVSGGTAIQAGEPLHSVATLTSGVASANTYVLAAADTPVIGYLLKKFNNMSSRIYSLKMV